MGCRDDLIENFRWNTVSHWDDLDFYFIKSKWDIWLDEPFWEITSL